MGLWTTGTTTSHIHRLPPDPQLWVEPTHARVLPLAALDDMLKANARSERRCKMQKPATHHNMTEDEAREAKRQEQIRRNQAAIEMLKEWEQGDEEEQRETWEVIEKGLREHPITFRTYEL